jgi:hypothetical protein
MASHKTNGAEKGLDTDGPSYASLTAGLLARKGEAMPAAAAFTTESVAQHIPAQKLAQESAQLGKANTTSIMDDDCGLTASSIDPPGTVYEEGEIASELLEDAKPAVEGGDSGSMEERSAFIEKAFSDQSEEPLLAGTLDEPLGAEDKEESALAKATKEMEHRDAPVSPESGFASRLVAATVDRAADLLAREGAEKEAPQADEAKKKVDDGKKKTDCATSKAIAADKIKSAFNAASSGGTALHLDPRRFIRLQIAAMKLEVDRKELLSAALDAYLDALDEEVFADCSCMRKGLI